MADVRLVLPGDSDPLARFLSEFPDERRSVESWLARLRYWWDDNPACGPDTPRGWVLVDSDRIVGFIGNVPTLFQLGGEPRAAMNATTWRVLPVHRSQSMELMLAFTGAGQRTVIFDTTPNEAAERVIQAFQFKRLPGSRPGVRFWPTSPSRLLGRLPGGRNLPKPVVALLAAPVKVATRLVQGRRASPDLVVRLLSYAGREFDQLWERTKRQYAATNVRGSAEVTWLFSGTPQFSRHLLGCYRGDELVGYIVTDVHQGSSIRPLECIDLWAEEADPSIMVALLRAGIAHASRLDCGLFMVRRFDEAVWAAAGQARLLLSRRDARPAYLRQPRSHGFDMQEAYLVPAQGDAWV